MNANEWVTVMLARIRSMGRFTEADVLEIDPDNAYDISNEFHWGLN